MPRLTAFAPFDQRDLDFNRIYAGAYDFAFLDDFFLDYDGTVYRDVFLVEWTGGIAGFGGPALSVDPVTGNVHGGRVTGYFDGYFYGGSLYDSFEITGLDLSAAALFDAFATPSRRDDARLIDGALAGADRFDLSDYSDFAFGRGGDDVMLGRGGADTLLGGPGDDLLGGHGGADRLRGGTGDDTLRGHAGDDDLRGGSGDDRLTGDAGHDRLVGAQGRDVLSGGGGDDTLSGGAHEDIVLGGAGADVIVGGAGADTLRAGIDDARDVFLYRAVSDSATGGPLDRIHDFEAGEDAINLRRLGEAAEGGALAFSQDGPAANAAWLGTAASATYVLVDVTGDGRPDVTITLVGATDVTGADLLL